MGFHLQCFRNASVCFHNRRLKNSPLGWASIVKIWASIAQSWAPQIYTQIRNRKYRKTARGGTQPQFRKFAIHLRQFFNFRNRKMHITVPQT